MSEPIRSENKYIGYEYRDFTVNHSMESVYVDGYHSFGWTLEGIVPSIKGVFTEVLKFKRDRKIINKAELTRLQRQFESCAAEIETLERSKIIAASAVAYIIGAFGTAFIAGAVFAHNAGMIPLTIILAIPGFVGWIIPYFCYSNIRGKKTEKVTPLIENKYDEIYEVCEKANGLLNK